MKLGVLANAFKQMASDLARTQQALKESEEQSRSILETASDAFIGMDQNGLITDWNHQARGHLRLVPPRRRSGVA